MVRKTKWHSKIGARALATAMSAAMGVSSLSAAMPGSMAYAKTDNEDADEILILDDSNADESEIEISEESSIEAETLEDSFMSESASDDNDDTEVADYDVEETSPVVLYADGRSFDDSKVDAWDFGAEDLGENYNNRLDVETIILELKAAQRVRQ